ncbi:MAG: S-methyl-5-thioribose kinase [Anaerolineae bacterium]|nr:S-methyl-5-thioribose kinase [Anaerolineae bacterium]
MTYRALDEKTVLDYVRSRPDLKQGFSDTTALSAGEIGDGNLNLVFIVRNSKNPRESAVIKQALPYLRVAGDSWPLTRERMRFEAQALLLYNQLTPGLSPKVYDYDEEMSLVGMENLADCEVMRKPLVERQRFPDFVEHISTFLATILFKTSDLYLSGVDKKTLQATYVNPHLCKIQEDFVFTNPYQESPENNWNAEIDAEVQAVRSNAPLKLAIADLKEKYMTQAQALIHSDLHTGSIMVNAQDTRVIDPEFSFFGPMGYDVGALLSNLVLNFGSHYAHTPDPAEREVYQEYLLDLIGGVWEGFAAKFEQLWIEHHSGELVPDAYWKFPGGDTAFATFRRQYMRRLLQDTAGLGACESLRRMMGIVSVWDITSIQDQKLRAVAERFVIRVSSRWIMERASFDHIEDLLGIVREEASAVVIA